MLQRQQFVHFLRVQCKIQNRNLTHRLNIQKRRVRPTLDTGQTVNIDRLLILILMEVISLPLVLIVLIYFQRLSL